MNPKATAILFAVAAALAAFVYFYEIEGGEERLEAEEAEKRLFADVEQEDIDAITLHTSDGIRVRMRRIDDRWRIADPIDFAADAFAADGLASALASMQSESQIEQPRSAEVYGLDEEDGVVRFSAGGVEYVLHTGDKAPVGANRYASVEGTDSVYIVESHRISSLSKAYADLRDKRIANFDTGAVARLGVTWPDGRVELQRGDEGWRIESPIQARADDITVDELLRTLSFLRAEGFVDEVGPDSQTGMDRPAFAAKIGLDGEGAAEVEIAFGAIGPDAATRLVRGAEKSLYAVSSARFDELPTGLEAFRFRQLAEFSSFDASRIEFGLRAADGSTIGITATRGEEGWSSEPESFEPGKLDSLVTGLSRLRAESILADELGPAELEAIGLEPPGASILVFAKTGDEPIAEVHLGTPRPEGIPARIPGLPTVFDLSPDAADTIPVSHEAFLNRFAAPADPEPQPELEPQES